MNEVVNQTDNRTRNNSRDVNGVGAPTNGIADMPPINTPVPRRTVNSVDQGPVGISLSGGFRSQVADEVINDYEGAWQRLADL